MGSHTEIISLIARAREAGLVLWVEGSRLRFRTTATTIPEDLRAELRTQRQAIIEVLILEAAVRVERCPLAVNQRGLWYLNHLAPQSSAYNLSFIVRVHGALDRSALEETLQIIVDRHESLRTIFPGIDGEPVRIVVGHAKASLEQTDATSCPPEDVRNLVRAEHAWPFDLTHGPVFRARLFRETPERHILQLVVHHLVADGTSLFVLGEELFETYSALLKGTPLPTRENQATFSEFVDWQARALTAADADAKYWTGVLQPPPPPLDLPTDRPRPRFRRMKGATIRRQLDQKIVTGLHELAKQEGTTDFVLLLSIWFLLLHRLSGKNDVTVGTPVLGRPAARFERTVGDLINMLPLRVRDIANLSFRELVQQVREIVLNGMARQDFPLPRMVEMQDRHAEHLGPPFQTLFLLQHFGRSSPLERLMFSEEDQEVTYNELTLSSYSIDQQEGQFDLALDLWPAGDRMLCLWRIDTELFDMETVEAWADSYESLTASVVADPLAAVTRLPLLSHEVKEKQIRTFNATEREYPREATVLSLFSGQVKRRPSAVAVSFEGDELSYAQLDARSTRLARHLQTLGVGPNTHAGVCLDRGLDMLVAVLGILKAGGAYVPLDPGFPAERLGYMLKDSGVQVLVTQDGLGQRLFPAAAVHRVCMDSDALVIGQQSTESLPVQAGSQDCAYVIYTSGSTGRSKGVEIEHRALTNFLCSMAREPGLEEHDVLVAVTTLSFDIAGLELFLPLIVGARIELVSRESGLDGERLARIIASSGATVMQATPATWRMLLESGWQGCPQLKVLCGGEAMGRDLAQRLLPVVGEVWNLYGPTETTIWSSVARISSAADISIGRPIANTRMYVLDEHGEPVPRGVVGELWIGGAGVARGYLNRAELTGERFVRDPYHEGTRMYRTGDLARHLPDGRLECLGRIDNQVKIRGYRIELEEIEAALSAHTGVYDCIVTARKEHAGDLRLLAYVVPNGAHRPAIEDLRTHLKTILPDYMIPSGFAFLDTIPLTPNGKVDRNALPTLGEDLSDLTVDYVAPRNHVERVMAEIWAEVLGVKSVGVFDHFFELGGHSLSATRLIGRLKSTLQIDVPLTSIFIEPTIAGLSKRIFYDDYAQRYYYVGEICRWNRLVPAQPKGSRVPFFMVAGFMDADDTLRVLSRLIPHLGLDQPLYGFQPRWLDGHSERYSGAEEAALEFLADLRTVQPKGPYLLGGDCAGGIVALVMAQELIRQGEEVRLLVMFDTHRPSPLRALALDLYNGWNRVKHILNVLEQIIRASPRLKLKLIRDLGRRKLKPVQAMTEDDLAVHRLHRLREDYMRTMYRYRVETYPGHISLIVNAKQHALDKTLGWKSVALGSLEVHSTPGDHWTRFLHGEELAKRLLGSIERAQAARAARASSANATEMNGSEVLLNAATVLTALLFAW